MLAFIVRILTVIAALWFVQWVIRMLSGRGRQRPAPGRPGQAGGPAQRMVKDPVCGMYMDPRLAVRLDRREGDLFFCSEACREKYRERADA